MFKRNIENIMYVAEMIKGIMIKWPTVTIILIAAIYILFKG